MKLHDSTISISILAGANVPRPVPAHVIAAVESLSVTYSDDNQTGFQMILKVGRSSRADMYDYPLLTSSFLKIANRIIVIVRLMGHLPEVLVDGIINHLQLQPSNEPGASRMTISGQDISVLMTLEEKQRRFDNDMKYSAIVRQVLQGYRDIIPQQEITIKNDSIPPTSSRNQNESDHEFLTRLAEENCCVFYVIPGSGPTGNKAYFGPRIRSEKHPQNALSCNMGALSNVENISFTYDSAQAFSMAAEVLERGEIQSVRRREPESEGMAQTSPTGSSRHWQRQSTQTTPMEHRQAEERVQCEVNQAARNTVTASGDLDVARYGGLLQARRLVMVRGVGNTFNGQYYVKSVMHSIQSGSYKQQFTLSRDGVDSTVKRIPIL